jgi:hypothetical protein
MKTTVEIQDALLRSAREAARREGTTLRALLEEGLRQALRSREKGRTPAAFRFATFRGDGPAPGVRLEDWEQVRGLAYEGRGG